MKKSMVTRADGFSDGAGVNSRQKLVVSQNRRRRANVRSSRAAEKVQINKSANRNKQDFKPAPKLARTTFCTSREMDFFSEKELVTQTGHERGEWPLVILKELIDNSLDACEDADIPPVIRVVADAGGISVIDNGPGLPEATLSGALDFTIRTSNREAYVSPCRGAQGNALKTLIPMARVLDPEDGRFIVQAHDKRHVITCGVNPVSQRAEVHDDVADPAKSTNQRSGPGKKEQAFCGTEMRIEWAPREDGEGPLFDRDFDSSSGRWLSLPDRCRALVEGFALFNSHATITLEWFGTKTTWKATDAKWVKWKPCHPTSAHWYELPHLERLIGATDRLVSDFIAEFDGLARSETRTRVLLEAELKRVKLSGFVVSGRLDSDRIAKLLAAMQRHTKLVKPKRLGLIGENHLKERLLAMGVKPESFRYSRKLSDAKSTNRQYGADEKASSAALPWVLESAFGWLGNDAKDERKIYAGANWSAAITNPFRTFGHTGEGLETALSDMRATRNEPVVFVLHLAHPRVQYADRGKSALVIGGAA